MDTEDIKKIGFIFLGIAASSSLIFALKLQSVIFMIWQTSPYIFMAYFLKKRSDSKSKSILILTAIVIVSIVGIYGAIEIIYFNPDPQSPIALFFLSILQVILFGVFNVFYQGVKNFRLR